MPRPLPPPTSTPFHHPGKRASALLLHGFTSTPYEVCVVGEALGARGIAATGVLLPGHGLQSEALHEITAEMWIESAERAFLEMPASRPRFVVGSSMGGLLGILLAARFPVDGLALLAPALVMQPTGMFGVHLAHAGLGMVLPLIEKSEPGGDLGCPEGQQKNPTYRHMSTRGLAQFDRLRRMARPRLSEVSCPVCTIHGARDRTIDPVSSEEVLRRVRGPWAEHVILPRSRHILGLDVDRDETTELVVQFLEELLDECAPGRAPGRSEGLR